VGIEPYLPYSGTISHMAYFLFQMTFAVIAAAIISGSIVGRLRFRAWISFIFFWTLLGNDGDDHFALDIINGCLHLQSTCPLLDGFGQPGRR